MQQCTISLLEPPRLHAAKVQRRTMTLFATMDCLLLIGWQTVRARASLLLEPCPSSKIITQSKLPIYLGIVLDTVLADTNQFRKYPEHAIAYTISSALADAFAFSQPCPRPLSHTITQSSAIEVSAPLNHSSFSFAVAIKRPSVSISTAQWAEKLHTGRQVTVKRKKLHA
jgi:hypothetical protein